MGIILRADVGTLTRSLAQCYGMFLLSTVKPFCGVSS